MTENQKHPLEIKCMDCDATLHPEVLQSAAGYYVGYFCPNCGPYDRTSWYHKTPEKAQQWLDTWIEAETAQ